MGTCQENRERLRQLLEHPDSEELEVFLLAESRLPGPRANLELAADVALIAFDAGQGANLLPIFQQWLTIETPARTATEYLPFCAINGLGGLYLKASSSDQAKVLELLRTAANSENWRLREAVSLALQFIGERDPEAMMAILRAWLDEATLLELRAAIATVAHPPILSDHPAIADEGLSLAGQIFSRIQATTSAHRKQEPFKVLTKGMAFALSVVVAASQSPDLR
jgi:hypothetical protein